MTKYFVLFLTILTFQIIGCAQKPEGKKYEHTNALIHETSPYLLQHAHNPVDWIPWSQDVFKIAKSENKLVIVSIGYSSCHWCHVMESESFENDSIATFMNDNFICVKVDREERMDVDHVYMSSVSLLTENTGWPLNCFVLPNGDLFHGGTYYSPDGWMKLLKNVQAAFEANPAELQAYADQIKKGISSNQFVDLGSTKEAISSQSLKQSIQSIQPYWDQKYGGFRGNTKFPMTSVYNLMLNHAFLENDTVVLTQLTKTLNLMMQGGIYDQIGGGFSRYATDEKWKVPHFEKTLYNNGQLLSVYSNAYKITQNNDYKQVVEQTIAWLEREMITKNGSFYSALDADSEGEEGKFYVWTKQELKSLLPNDFEWVRNYYSVNYNGLWENDQYILLRTESNSEFAKQMNWSEEELRANVKRVNSLLLSQRTKRIRPETDDKSITSWNAMTISGLVSAYEALGNPEYLELAENNAKWILNEQLRKDGSLFHTSRSGKPSIDGFLDDYAFTVKALIELYEVTFNETYLTRANKIMRYAIDHFSIENQRFFYYSKGGESLAIRPVELDDRVIPSSNSIMAENLIKLGTLFERKAYLDQAELMMCQMNKNIATKGYSYANWYNQAILLSYPFYEVAITGDLSIVKLNELNRHYLPNTIFMGGKKSSLPLTQGKFDSKMTLIFVCHQKVCQKPVNEVVEAIKQMKQR